MKMKLRIIGSLAIAVVSVAILGSCGDPDSPGLEYMPDMYRSPAIEPYVDYGHIQEREHMDLKKRMSAMTPPSNTIPYYGTDSLEVMLMLPYKWKADKAFKLTHGMSDDELWYGDSSTYDMAAADKNPLPLPSEADSLEFKAFWGGAKNLFMQNCAHCHGEKGDGKGPMVQSGAYSGVPDYKNLTIKEGQMFYSIYYGRNMMGSHRSIVNKKEIWTLVHYIHRLIDGNYGKAAKADDASAEEGTEGAEGGAETPEADGVE